MADADGGIARLREALRLPTHTEGELLTPSQQATIAAEHTVIHRTATFKEELAHGLI
jgi:hypothetical protein